MKEVMYQSDRKTFAFTVMIQCIKHFS